MKKILAAILLILGLTYLYLGVFSKSEGKDSSSWPSTTGVVIESKVNNNGDKTYTPIVYYEYKVNDRPYTSKRIHVESERFPSEEKAKAVSDKHPKGSEVTAYYNPKIPEKAVLIRGGGGMNIKNVAVGSAATIFAILALIFAGGSKPPEPETPTTAIEPE